MLLASTCLMGQSAPVANPKLLILGHAGSGFFTPISPFNFRPPSSWRGVQHALDLGADGVEVDLQLSQDSVVILYHDQRLENNSTGRGCVSEHSAAQLVQLRYRGGWPYDWFHKEQPITFDTLLARFSRRPTFPRLHLDLHEDDQCLPPAQQAARSSVLIRQLARSLRRYQVPLQQVSLVTQEPTTVRLARAEMPTLPIGLEVTADDITPGLGQAKAEHVKTLVLDAGRATPQHMAQARAAGMSVVLFGGRSPKSIRKTLTLQPDEMEVDNVRRLLILQGRRK
ncbi:glycerophosphoryl diester phosphodiesterase [Hymenobacter arizonensis]|uniref:Glycerophosphoryl diester phosphodiesterase n=2 Tax=Hymenobacter arizonensis TaxID=1227077 RepID=A0A1I5V632_HYMAR|nr:glycerophosphoryl diester phosphodiesterase [Hymenobacter arizonensis]